MLNRAHKYLPYMPWLPCVLLPIFWLSGVYVVDIARVLAILFFFLTFNAKINRRNITYKIPEGFIFGFLCVLPIVLAYSLIVRGLLGDHGIDHAIFSQAVESFSQGRGFQTSLNRIVTASFLRDHFAPILAVPTVFTSFGFSAPTAVSLMQSVCFTLTLTLTFFLSRKLGLSRGISMMCVLLLSVHGTYRHQLFYGAQVEYWAHPFIVAAILFQESKKYWFSIFMMIAACLCKETMFFLMFMFGLILLTKSKDLNRAPKIYGILLVTGAAVFSIIYFGMQPLIWGKSYDYIQRIDLSSWLLRPDIWLNKAIYWLVLTGSFLFLVFQSRWFALLFPFIGLSYISNFPDMYDLSRHYTATPTLLLFLCLLYRLRNLKNQLNLTVLLCCLISLGWGLLSDKPLTKLKLGDQQKIHDSIGMVDSGAVVLTSEKAAVLLVHVPHLKRFFDFLPNTLANASPQFLVHMQGENIPENIQAIAKNMNDCSTSPLVKVYCLLK